MPKITDEKVVHVAFRIEQSDAEAVQKLADKKFDGNFSMAMRWVIKAGVRVLRKGWKVVQVIFYYTAKTGREPFLPFWQKIVEKPIACIEEKLRFKFFNMNTT